VSKTSRSGLDPSQAWKALETIDPFGVLRLVSATQPRSVRGAEAVSSNARPNHEVGIFVDSAAKSAYEVEHSHLEAGQQIL